MLSEYPKKELRIDGHFETITAAALAFEPSPAMTVIVQLFNAILALPLVHKIQPSAEHRSHVLSRAKEAARQQWQRQECASIGTP